MGIAFSAIQKLNAMQVLSEEGIDLLDIGSSNLYNADKEGIIHYIKSFTDKKSRDELDEIAETLAKGSSYDLVTGGRNEAFIGELFEACGINYLSFDIANGYKTEIIDLNLNCLPTQHHNAYDVVLNFGTTEHILNQYNCFKVIHEATRMGGYMVHQLPISGFTDHGYFVYTGRNLFDLAKFNNYEIVDLWFDGPAGDDGLYESIQSYKELFPVFERLNLSDVRIPNHAITIIYKKTRDKPFAGMLEITTSVGNIPSAIENAYGASILKRVISIMKSSKLCKPVLNIMRMMNHFFRK